MTLKKSFLTCSTALAIGIGMLGSANAAPSENPRKQMSYPAWGDYTDAWTRDDAAKIELTEDNTLPLLEEMPVDIVTDEVWIWDTWPMTNLDSRTVNYKGYKVIFSLTADRDLDFPQRHWTAEIGYSISRDGKSWEYQGDVFPEDVEVRLSSWVTRSIFTTRLQAAKVLGQMMLNTSPKNLSWLARPFQQIQTVFRLAIGASMK